MASLIGIPPEIVGSICNRLPREDLRNVRLVSRRLNGAAQRLLFHTVFLKINPSSFGKLSNISNHEVLRLHVRNISLDGRGLGWAEASSFERWLNDKTGAGIGVSYHKSDRFLSLFSREQLGDYFSSFSRYTKIVQALVLNENNEMVWLRKTVGRFPRLSTVEYSEIKQILEKGSELKPLGSQRIRIKPEEGLGHRDKHFWMLALAVFHPQQHPSVTELRGEMLKHENARKWAQIIPQLQLAGLLRLSLEFVCEHHWSQGPNWALADFLTRAPSLISLRLSYGDCGGLRINPALLPRSRILECPLYWEHLCKLSLSCMVVSPSVLQQLLLRHSATLKSLELSFMALHHNGESIVGEARALWIMMIRFLSRSMSLEHVNLFGYFTTNTNESWSIGCGGGATLNRRRYEGCLLDQIEHFITHGGPCPFTPKDAETSSYDTRSWVPEHSWIWEGDETWTSSTL